jgi:phage regulator Rha-like protein
MGEGQFEIEKKHVEELNKIDNNIVNIVNRGDEKTFKTEFRKLTDYARKNGKKLEDKTIKPSDIILPPADLTFEEAKKIFSGEGLIPD